MILHLIGLLFLFGLSIQAQAQNWVELAKVSLPSEMKFEGTRIGGISALMPADTPDHYWAVSDDRGKYGPARVYKLSIRFEALVSPPKLSVQVLSVHPVKWNSQKSGTGHGAKEVPSALEVSTEGQGSKKAKSAKPQVNLNPHVLDLEAITQLPWGGVLLSTEGDLNKKPRVLPAIFEVSADFERVREYPLPSEFVAELSGRQTKGMKNNLGIEAMTRLPSKKILLSSEGALYQDTARRVRWLVLESKEAWTLSPTQNFFYEMDELSSPLGQSGVTELLALSETEILVLERELALVEGALRFKNSFYQVELPATLKSEALLTKKLVHQITGEGLNLEAMAQGPRVQGESTLLIVNDNNFEKNVNTTFFLLRLNKKSVPN